MRHSAIVVAVASVSAIAVPALARQSESDLERRMREMAERIESLEKDNKALRNEVGDLRAEQGENWLTEQRATEIRSLVQDVLADADARASLQSSGMTAGWDNGFFLSSPDGRFRLEIEGEIQFRYIFNYRQQENIVDFTDQYKHGFENTRTRLTFRGHVFDKSLQYLIQGGFSRAGGDAPDSNPQTGEVKGGNFQLYDAWVRWQFVDEWSLRAGQFKLPFNREELVYSGYQLAIERSLINESLNIGRSQGVELEYQGDWMSWDLAYSDGGTDNLLGGIGQLVNTFPANSPWSIENVEYSFTSRLQFLLAGDWKQFQQLTSPPGDPFGVLVGAAMHYQENEFGSSQANVSWLNSTADISVAFGGANLFSSFTWSYSDGNFGIWNIWGLVVQGGVYVAPKLELYARWELGQIDSNNNLISPPDLSVITAGVNWYIDGQDAKLSLDVGVGLDDVSQFWASDLAGWRPSATTGQLVVRTQFQLLF
ncbi:MAG: porin [Phycisphaerales bacterium]